jgi:hypothetical protein
MSAISYSIDAPRHETPGQTIKFADALLHQPGIAHVRVHYAGLVGVWMKTTVIADRHFKKMDEMGFFPTRVEVRPLPNFEGLSVALRGRQVAYVEAQPREAVFHE